MDEDDGTNIFQRQYDCFACTGSNLVANHFQVNDRIVALIRESVLLHLSEKKNLARGVVNNSLSVYVYWIDLRTVRNVVDKKGQEG